MEPSYFYRWRWRAVLELCYLKNTSRGWDFGNIDNNKLNLKYYLGISYIFRTLSPIDCINECACIVINTDGTIASWGVYYTSSGVQIHELCYFIF